jgi:hypothetical protein
VPDVTLSRFRFGVVGAFGPPEALDALQVPAGARACRIARDELALVCSPEAVSELLAAVARQVARGDGGGFALDLSDGWAGFTLSGDVERAFSHLSELEPPSDGGFVQGDVLRAPVRVLGGRGRIDLLVPSPWGSYLRDELLRALRALDVAEAETLS